MPTPPRTGMRADIEELISEWGVQCTITRRSTTVNSEGRLDGSFSTVTSGEQIWIQPVGGQSRVVDFGINDETTHLGWQKHDGTQLLPKDRILVTGDTYYYDVMALHIKESHRLIELKLVTRS